MTEIEDWLSDDICLPDVVHPSEKLARNIIGSSKLRKCRDKLLYNEENGYSIATGLFIDGRYDPPTVLSVNRISSILDKAHELGLRHQCHFQPSQTYHGYAKIEAEVCYQSNCSLQKDPIIADSTDSSLSNPYHANMIYSHDAYEDIQEVASRFALKAEFIPFESGSNC